MAAASEDDELPREVLDPRVIDEMFNLPGKAGSSLLADIAATFMRLEPARVAGLAGLARERQGGALADQAHLLAGSCAVIVARQLQAAARFLEGAARSGDWASVTPKLAAVDRAWSALRAEFGRRGLPPG
jgi:HPt (histidine-containing phosphotransfer) domain-containing protein